MAHLPNLVCDTDLWLARRPPGDWVLMRHERDIERLRVLTASASLGTLYQRAMDSAGDIMPPALASMMAAWLKGVLTGMFDASDPVEAAEQVLFALSGTLTVVPRAAL